MLMLMLDDPGIETIGVSMLFMFPHRQWTNIMRAIFQG
jgi:hypothetical protein